MIRWPRLADGRVRLAMYAVLALAFVWAGLGDAAGVNEHRDAQVLALYERAAALTVHKYGELPLWNPWYCGGLDALGAPQTRWASPAFLATLALGAERAQPVIAFAFALLGMEGSYRWLRLRVSRASAAAIVAPVFAMSGHFAVAWFRGWIGFFGFELVPWILFGATLAARGRIAGAAVASLAFAVVLGTGGTFAAPLVAVAAAIEGARALHESASRKRALAMLVATALLMGAVSAFRLWPLAETLANAPRIMGGTPGHGPKTLLDMAVGFLTAKDGYDFETPAGAFYVGAAFLGASALCCSDRRGVRALVITLLLVWLSAGYAHRPALFALLRAVPGFGAMRYPERFLWLAILFGSECAAHALTALPTLAEDRRMRLATWVVLCGAIVWTWAQEIATFARVSHERRLSAVVANEDAPFHQSRGNRWIATHVQATGAGSLSCWETHAVHESTALRGDLGAEEYLDEPAAGRVKRVAWTPSTISVDATLVRPATLLVNQNWNPGWRASVGRVVSRDGLLAVELPSGEHLVKLAFRPWSAVAGTTVSLAALAALAILGVRARRGRAPFARGSRAATTVLLLLPLVVASAARGMSPEPPWPTVAPRNADGSSALAFGTEGATRVDATFDLPVRVEAARADGPDSHGNVAVTLYVRRTGALPRETSLFVELAPESGASKAITNEHVVVASSFYLAGAPEGALVRDVFGVHLGSAAPGRWRVRVGLGHHPARLVEVADFTVR